MAIYLMGDMHGELEIRELLPEYFPEGQNLTRDDYVIILGDFGCPFTVQTREMHWSQQDKKVRDKLAELHFTILFVDGNHDNHDFWYRQPLIKKFGGFVQALPGTDNVFHLRRGEYYTIDGKSIFTFGGALSRDIEFRTEGKTWWRGELASPAERVKGFKTLEEHNWEVDYILTHTPPQSIISDMMVAMISCFEIDPVAQYLEEVLAKTHFKFWFCGHMHTDKIFYRRKVAILYDSYVKLNDFQEQVDEYNR